MTQTDCDPIDNNPLPTIELAEDDMPPLDLDDDWDDSEIDDDDVWADVDYDHWDHDFVDPWFDEAF